MAELIFPTVYEDGRPAGYGGDQDWFRQEFARKAGCASVTATNLAAVYAANFEGMSALYRGQTDSFEKSEYVAAMNVLYDYLTPGPAGYPYPRKFAQQFVRFAADRGVTLHPVIMERTHGYEECRKFVRTSIEEGHPVALLILHHRAKSLEDDNWHWVTVTGWLEDEEGEKIIFSDCGSRDLHLCKVLFEQHWRNLMHMVRFTDKAPT